MTTRASAVEVITSLERAGQIEPEWDALARSVGRTPFALPAMALAWWRHLGRGELLIVSVRDGSGELRALAPLHRRSLGPVRLARWLGTGLGSISELAVRRGSDGAARAIWDALGDHVDALDLVETRHGGAGLLELRRSTGWNSSMRVSDLCPTIDLAGIGSLDQLLASRRNLRKKLAHYDRSVAATGERFDVEVIVDRPRLKDVLPEIVEVYDAAEQARSRAHLLAGQYRAFALDALETAADRGQLAAFVGRLGDRAVAFDIAIRVGTVLADWVGRFRPDVAELSPGHLVLREVVRWSLANEIRTVDLLNGDDEYKRRWSSASYDTVDVVAARGRWRRAAPFAIGAARTVHPAVRHLRTLLPRNASGS